MKYLCFLFIIVSAILFGGCNPTGTGKSSSAPVMFDDGVIHADNTVFDFGVIEKSNSNFVKFYFNLTNISSNTVSIETVDPSCNCMKLDKYDKSIESGGNWKLSGRIETAKFAGRFSKPLFVKFNKSVVLLRIKGEII